MKIIFRTVKEFEEFYFPEHCRKYPIKMRVSEEEKEQILRARKSGKE